MNIGGSDRGAPRSYFSPYTDAEPARRAAGRVPHRPADRRGGEVHRGRQGRARSSCTCRTTRSTPRCRRSRTSSRSTRPRRRSCRPERPRVPPRRRAQARQVQDHPVYAAMVESLDQSVGRVMATLERLEPGRPHDRDLHVRQRRPVDVGRLAHLERPAARGEGLALRRRHPRAPDRPLARGVEAGSRLPRADDQHRLLPDPPRDDRTGAAPRAAPRRRQPRAVAQGRHASGASALLALPALRQPGGSPLRGGPRWETSS